MSFSAKILILGSLVFSCSAQASPFKYSYFEFGYEKSKLDTNTDSKIDGDSLSISGSFAVTSSVNALASYLSGSYDPDIDNRSFAIGLGYHLVLSRHSDLFAQVKFIDNTLGAFDDTGHEISAGIQFAKNPNYQLNGEVIQTSIFDDDQTAVRVGMRIKVANDKSFGIHYLNGDESSSFGISIRMDI